MIDWRTEYEHAIAERNGLIQRVQVAETELEIARNLLCLVPVPDYRSEYAAWKHAVDDFLEATQACL